MTVSKAIEPQINALMRESLGRKGGNDQGIGDSAGSPPTHLRLADFGSVRQKRLEAGCRERAYGEVLAAFLLGQPRDPASRWAERLNAPCHYPLPPDHYPLS